ncbi:MAG: transketolase [Treponema sp.]|nr:transketolase [Treponema sp.]
MLDNKELYALKKFALEIRIGIVESIMSRGFGHIGGSLSIADVLAVLYGSIMTFDAQHPHNADRDRVVCSKGHAGPALYATLGLLGCFPYDDIKTLNQPGTNFPSHCDRKKTPGIDMTTGSLGQGASVAVGMALGCSLRALPSRVFLITGDGELNEGQVWEAAMFATAKKIDNLVWLVDCNKKQLDGYTKDVLTNESIAEKCAAFGFETHMIDGHDIAALHETLTLRPSGRPLAVVLDTVKGKGIPEVEETVANHSMTVGQDVFQRWLSYLRDELAKLQ